MLLYCKIKISKNYVDKIIYIMKERNNINLSFKNIGSLKYYLSIFQNTLTSIEQEEITKEESEVFSKD